LKSKESRLKYSQRINRFFDFIEIPPGDTAARCKTFLEEGHDDSNYILNRVILFLQAHKEKIENKELASGTVRNYVNTIKLLCEVCEFPIPWKKILRGMPRGRRYASDRAPTIEEIRKIVEYPDRRIKCIVFTMSSSGIRLGAWDFRRESGEFIDDESWVLRNLWDLDSRGQGLASVPKRLKSSGVKRLMERAQHAQGVRKKLENGKKRHEFQLDHGFRKWFKTQCEIAGMKSINIETLMGHSIGVSDSYYRATEHDLLKDYHKVIDFLTIQAEHRLKKEVNELKDKSLGQEHIIKAKLDEKDLAIDAIRKKYDSEIILLKNTIADIQNLLRHPEKLVEIME
jgi:integrase